MKTATKMETTKRWYTFLCLSLLGFFSCGQQQLEFHEGELKIRIQTGEKWLHDFPLFMGIKVKNPPQFVIWITDPDTNYIGTVFCTHKAAREGWIMNRGNRRKEALPFWAHCRGVQEKDGLYLPTHKHPLADGITGATPENDYTLRLKPDSLSDFLLFAEFNHSTDFNDTYPRNAAEGTPGWSGGKEGSGQPALVYKAGIHLNEQIGEWVMQLSGHSSPDGTDGKLYTDMEGIDSALKIVKKIVVTRNK